MRLRTGKRFLRCFSEIKRQAQPSVIQYATLQLHHAFTLFKLNLVAGTKGSKYNATGQGNPAYSIVNSALFVVTGYFAVADANLLGCWVLWQPGFGSVNIVALVNQVATGHTQAYAACYHQVAAAVKAVVV